MTVSDAFAHHDFYVLRRKRTEKTRANYGAAGKSFVKAIGDIPVELVTVEHVFAWDSYMDQCGNQPSSRASNISRLREVFKHLQSKGYRVTNYRDMERPSIPKRTYTWLTFDEYQQLLSVIERQRDRAIIACLFSTGCRISELLDLNRGDISKDGIAIVTGKRDKQREVYFDASALAELQLYLDERKDTLIPLFVSGQYRRITVSRVEQLLHVYADAAGIQKNVTPHVLRHSFASDLKSNGADIYDIQQLLGHSQIATTMIYTHTSPRYTKAKHRQFHSQ